MSQNVSVKVENVSDTALWVAYFRGVESARSDALFQDPFALRLAGDRGKAIAKELSFQSFMQWMMTVRTVAIDRLVREAVSYGADCVLNLGCGLDTRPLRLDLPKSLKWIEADFPSIIQYKSDLLKGEVAKCSLQRHEVDLTNLTSRQAFFQEVRQQGKKILVITEGVLPYLTTEEVTGLADELRALPEFTFWIQDYLHGGFDTKSHSKLKKKMKSSPFKFQVKDWFEFFTKLGWTVRTDINANEEAKRLHRPLARAFPIGTVMWATSAFASQKRRAELRRQHGYVLLQAAPRS